MANEMSPIEKIKGCIENHQNFLLCGGAGSGKTYTLMEVLDCLYERDRKVRVACITFTKVAVKEIRGRAPYESLWVSTIHEFLWNVIEKFQKNLKSSLVELIEMENQEEKTGIKYRGKIEINNEYFLDKEISYQDWVKIEDGVISHDEVLKIANYMFKKYPLLCRILKDKYDYILIDEYQDTEKQVVDIFLDACYKEQFGKHIVGFFGDSMQSIYAKGVGSLSKEVFEEDIVQEVIKQDNWRCSKAVIGLINNIRNDGLIQEASGDNKDGSISFLYSSNSDIDINKVKDHEKFKNWDFSNASETKELYLTHSLISKKAGFDELFQIYDKDKIIEHVRKIKKKLKEDTAIEVNIEEITFGEILALDLVRKSPLFNEFVADNNELFEYAKKMKFVDLQDIYLSKDLLIEGGSEKKEDRGNNKDDLNKHLSKIQKCIHLYDDNKIYEFTKVTEFKIKSVKDKRKLKEVMDELKDIDSKSIEDIIELAHNGGIVRKDDKFNNFIENKKYVYDRVKGVKYIEFKNIYDYEEGYSPYSTQHGIKGAEFENVLVILDNGGWNQYNFDYLFENTAGKEPIIERTRKMFYVSCSRAKNNLVIFYHNPSDLILNKAREWFGDNNVILLD